MPINDRTQTDSHTVQGSWKGFELYPVVNDRTLEIVKEQLIFVLRRSLQGSRIKDDKKEVKEIRKEAVKILRARDHDSDSKKGQRGQILRVSQEADRLSNQLVVGVKEGGTEHDSGDECVVQMSVILHP